MTAPNQKTVIVLGGPTGPTGTFEMVNIVPNFTGATGEIAQWRAATGATGPNGTFKSIVNIGPTGPNASKFKTAIIPGFSSGGGGGGGFDPATLLNASLSVSNTTLTTTAAAAAAGAFSVTAHNSLSGKWYFEFKPTSFGNNNTGTDGCGVGNSSATLAGLGPSVAQNGTCCYYNSGSIYTSGSQVGGINGGLRSPNAGDVFGIRVDLSAAQGTISFQNLTTGAALQGPFNLPAGTGWRVAGFNDDNASGGVDVLNTVGSFVGSLPSGFSAWG